MNTTKVGEKFEDKVAEIISDLIESGRLPYNPSQCKVLQKPKYYSPTRDKEIEFDISVEIYADNDFDRYLHLIIIECKNYSHAVPVDDIEEFTQKIRNVSGYGGYAVKGMVVTTSRFQSGCLKEAESHRIGLGKVNDKSRFKWVLKRASANFYKKQPFLNPKEIESCLLDDIPKSDYLKFFGKVGDFYTQSLDVAIKKLLIEGEEDEELVQRISSSKPLIDDDKSQVDFIPKEEIQEKCKELRSLVHAENKDTPLFYICDKLQEEYDLTISFVDDLGKDSGGENVLGRIEFNPDRILILEKQKNFYRKKFTLAHELGHYFLEHGKYLDMEFYSEKDINKDYLKHITSTDIKTLEWQANHFASHLLLPREALLKEFLKAYLKQDLPRVKRPYIFVDDQPCNLRTYYQITDHLKREFQVSRQAIKYRLLSEKILRDGTNLKFI